MFPKESNPWLLDFVQHLLRQGYLPCLETSTYHLTYASDLFEIRVDFFCKRACVKMVCCWARCASCVCSTFLLPFMFYLLDSDDS